MTMGVARSLAPSLAHRDRDRGNRAIRATRSRYLVGQPHARVTGSRAGRVEGRDA
jgi:hypothetical protein